MATWTQWDVPDLDPSEPAPFDTYQDTLDAWGSTRPFPEATSTTTTPAPTTPEVTPEEESYRRNLLNRLSAILSESFDSATVQSMIEEIIKPALLQGLNEFDILRLLRDSAAHKEKFPEYHQRIENGFMAWDESTILRYRDDAKALAMQVLGVSVDDSILAASIANNVSLAEFEHKLIVRKRVQDIGGPVADFFANRLGIKLDDRSLQDFLDPEIKTPELDRAYEDAFFSEYGRQLGLNRSATAEDIEGLRSRGYSVERVMQNYEKMRAAVPAIDRLADIDAAIGADQGSPFDSFASAFDAYQFMDPTAQAEIGRLFSREVARFTTGGGVAAQGGVVAGLMDRSERAAY